MPTRIGRLLFSRFLFDFLDDGIPSLLFGAIDAVFVILADDLAIGGDGDDVEAVDFVEFLGFGLGGSGHAGAILVHLEEILKGDGCEGLSFFLDGDAFLGFDGLVEAVGPLPSGHFPAGEFIDDADFHCAFGSAFDDVVFVAFVNDVGAHGLVHEVGPFHVVADEEAADTGGVLGGGDALVREVGGFAIELDFVVLDEAFLKFGGFGEILLGLLAAGAGGVFFRLGFGVILVAFGGFDGALGGVFGDFGGGVGFVELDDFAGDEIRGAIFGGIIVGSAADDEGRSRFVDENGVDFVHNDKLERTLHLLGDAGVHIVAEEVEAEFAVGAVGDVAVDRRPGVHGLAAGLHVGLDVADGEAEVFECGTKPGCVAADEVVVDGDDVAVVSFEDAHETGERRDEGFAFTGGHFGDLAFVEHEAADELHIEAASAEWRAAFGIELARMAS